SALNREVTCASVIPFFSVRYVCQDRYQSQSLSSKASLPFHLGAVSSWRLFGSWPFGTILVFQPTTKALKRSAVQSGKIAVGRSPALAGPVYGARMCAPAIESSSKSLVSTTSLAVLFAPASWVARWSTVSELAR